MTQYKYNSTDLVRPTELNEREEFLLKDSKDIQSYYKVKLNVENFNQSYKNLKEFLKNNEYYLLKDVNNLELDLSIKNNILLSKIKSKISLSYINPFDQKKSFILGLKDFKKKPVYIILVMQINKR